jgi:hypothetical protein
MEFLRLGDPYWVFADSVSVFCQADIHFVLPSARKKGLIIQIAFPRIAVWHAVMGRL